MDNPKALDELIRKAPKLSQDEIKMQEDLKKRKRRNYTSLLEKDWGVTFESLDVIPGKDQVKRLQNWHPGLSKGVVLYGPVGTGKTTLCKAVINRFGSGIYECLFISVAEAMQRLKDTMDKSSTSSMAVEQEKLIKPALLIFDDLGADKASEWAAEKLFLIFEKRAALQKHTFFTTNCTPEQISKDYKERIRDRMIEHCSWVQFEGTSFRKRDFKNEI